MMLGTSYSLINSVVSSESFGFEVNNFDVEFQDNTKISVNGIPQSDEEGLKNSKEFTFVITNKSDKDVNYRLDIIENSLEKMSDVIHYSYKLNDSDYSSVYLLDDHYTINQNRFLERRGKDTYKIKIWLSTEADETVMNKVFSASISLQATQHDYKYATNVIETLSNNKQDNVIKSNNDYRYIGSNPNNYVWFNCKDGYNRGTDNCEIWRIIGSFDNNMEGEKVYKSLKIVSTTLGEEMSFNDDELSGLYDQSNINSYLNGTYFDMLNEGSKKIVLKAKWSIGNVSTNNFNQAYKEEKIREYYANVGLINYSDYLAIGNVNWLNSENDVMLLNKTMDEINVINNGLNRRSSLALFNYLPVVYLKPDVSIISGDGSLNNPYAFGIKYPMNYGKGK